MAVVTIPDITRYYLPKMVVKKVEILNDAYSRIRLVVDYDLQYAVKPGGSGEISRLINKYIRPAVVVMPSTNLALLYENYIKNYSNEIAGSKGKHMLPYSHYQPLEGSPIGAALAGDSFNFLNMRENKNLLASSIINCRFAISDNMMGTYKTGYAKHPKNNRTVTVTTKQYRSSLTQEVDEVIKQVVLQVRWNGKTLSSDRDTSNNRIDMYMYYFSILDFEALLTDDNFNENDLLAITNFEDQNTAFYDGSKRNYFHGQVGKELILSGDYDFYGRNKGLKVPENFKLIKRQNGESPSGLRIINHNGSYYGTTDFTSRQEELRGLINSNPDQLERLTTRLVPNGKIVDKRQIAKLSANERYENMSYNYTLDMYSNASLHRSELELLADKINNTRPSVQQSTPNMEKLLARFVNPLSNIALSDETPPLHSAAAVPDPAVTALFAQSEILKSKMRLGSRDKFKSSVIVTPDLGTATVEFMVIFDEEEIIKRNSVVMGFLAIKNNITRFGGEQLNAERLQLLAPREKLRTISAKVLRKKVSNKYDKPNKFGCFSGRSHLEDESLYNKNGVEVVCESYGRTPRTIDESIKFLSNASYNDMYSEGQTIQPVVNTEGSLVDMSHFLLSPDLSPSQRPPKKRAFAIKDRSIMGKLEGTYQYGMEIVYQDPADRLIEETLYKANVLVFCLQKLSDHLDSPMTEPWVIDRIMTEPMSKHIKSVMTSDRMSQYHDLVSIFYGYLGYEIDNFQFPDFSHLFPNPATVGNRVRAMLETAILNSVVDCYSLICTMRAIEPDITLEEISHLTVPLRSRDYSMRGVVSLGLERTVEIMKNLISNLSRLTNHPLSKVSIESKYNLDQNISPKARQRKTFKVSTWFENANGKDYYIDVTNLRSTSVSSLNEIISNTHMGKENVLTVYGDHLVTQEAIRQMYQKEIDKFNAIPGSSPFTVENNPNAIFTVTPDFYRLKAYTSREELAIPLFEEVAGSDYFAAAYSNNNNMLSADRIMNTEQGDYGYGTATQARKKANTFGMMLGMFHVLSHNAKIAKESSGNFINSEYAEGYNFLFDYYDPAVLISSLTTRQYYSNQRSTPISFMANSGFIADSPTVLDGGNTSIFSPEIGQYKPYLGVMNEIETSHLTRPDNTGRVPNIYSSTNLGDGIRNSMVRNYITYCRRNNNAGGIDPIYEANRYMLGISLALEYGTDIEVETTDTMITLALQHMLTEAGLTNEEATGASQTYFPGSYYYVAPGGGSSVYLNPLIYGEVRVLVKLRSTMNDMLLGGENTGIASAAADRFVTVGEIEDGLEPGLYLFTNLPGPGSTFSSSPSPSAPFRVIDDSDPRSRPPIVDSGLYTPGGEFRYPMNHPTKPGREYVGHYHVHPETGKFMEGMHHINQEHSIIERYANLNFQNVSVVDRQRTLREGYVNLNSNQNVGRVTGTGQTKIVSREEGTSGADSGTNNSGGSY